MKKLLTIAILSVFLLSCNNENKEGRIQQLETENPQAIDTIQGLETKAQQLENESKSLQIKIGSTYEGGIVFYVDETGEHGKVCSPKGLGKHLWDDAKKQCEDLIQGGYDDWYLPSKDELELMWKNLHRFGCSTKVPASALCETAIGGFSNGWYGASTENSSDSAWGLYFYNGNQTKVKKTLSIDVRAVRAF